MNMDEKDFEQQEQILSETTENSETEVVEASNSDLNSADKETEVETETETETVSETNESLDVSIVQDEKFEDKADK